MKNQADFCFSGSATGFPAQLGAYAYCSQYFNPRSFTGTSGGSLVSAVLATSETVLEAKRKMESILIPSLVDYYNPIPLFKLVSLFDNSKIGIIKGEKIYKTLKQMIPQKFCELKLPLTVVTTDINTREAIIFSQKTTPYEDVAFALRASISLPLIFSPVPYKDKLLVDGGLTRNFYLSNYKESDSVIGIKFNDLDDFKPVKNCKDMFSAMLFTAIAENEKRDIAECPQAQIIPVVIDINPFAFEKMDAKYMRDMYQKGFDLACKYLKV